MSPFDLADRWGAPAPAPRKVAWIAGTTFAHRGLHDDRVPENTLAAFEAAIAAGLGIELDVQRAYAGTAVVFHDWELDRLTERTGPVSEVSAADLSALRIAGSDETIPTLAQALAQVAGRAPVLIEIKSRRGMRRTAALCLAVRRVLEGYGGAHAVMSFDPRVSRWFWRHSPHTVRGLVVSEGDDRALPGKLRRRLALWHARPDFLAYDVRDLPSRFAAQQRARGLPLATWTVRGALHAERAARHADAAIVEGEGAATRDDGAPVGG